jgi:hypothetical protein
MKKGSNTYQKGGYLGGLKHSFLERINTILTLFSDASRYNRSMRTTNFKRALTIVAALSLSACEVTVKQDGTSDVTVDTTTKAKPKVTHDSSGDADTQSSSGGATQTQQQNNQQQQQAAQLSVFKNWGYLSNEMPINFTSLTLANEVRFEFDQYETGQLNVNGREIRWCVGKIEVTGTETLGVVTLSDMQLAWSIDPTGDSHSTYCSSLNSAHAFEVTANGLTFDGVLYAEQH